MEDFSWELGVALRQAQCDRRWEMKACPYRTEFGRVGNLKW